MKQLEVQIMGQNYLLSCPEGGESRLLAAVERVDSAMCKIRDSGKIRARERIAVLAALNLAFDLADGAPVATPEPERPRSSGARANAGEDAHSASAVLLTSLLERLDMALRDDGRLI